MPTKAKKIIERILIVIVLLIIIIIITGGSIFLYYLYTLPSPFQEASQDFSQSTKIYDRTGQILLYETGGQKQRTVVSLNDIPKYCQEATIAIEDQNFYSEPAFDVVGILRALLIDAISGKIVQGGSTITQQLVKNRFLNSEKTLTRKIEELVLALKIDHYYTKDQILDLYLNQIPYGSNLYGIDSASRAYFNKPVDQLDLAQCAILAAIPQAPTYYSPWGNHLNDLFSRQQIILNKMFSLGEISQDQLTSALKEKISFSTPSHIMLAPHFVNTVLDYLTQKYGEDMVNNGGLKVITTLDWNLQQAAEKAVAEGVKRNIALSQRYNAALVAESATSGQILALVGSADYYAPPAPAGCQEGKNCKFEGNFDVATMGLRQPGSSLKPFVYLDAFEKGYAPQTVLFDVPTEFVTNNPNCPIDNINYSKKNPQCFHPVDFENFQGPVSLTTALAQSINVVAVKLLYLVGLNSAINTMQQFGITTLNNPSRYGLSLVLGGGAVKLIDMISAYSALADNGVLHKQTMILSVTNSSGQVLESYQDQSQQVADPQYVEMVNNILSDPQARAGLFGASLNLTVFPGYDVALKTGTSNDYKDVWSFGYTPSLVVGVWAGNNDDSPPSTAGSSIMAAVPIWSDFMNRVIKSFPPESFPHPHQVIADKPILNGNYVINNQVHNILYYINPQDPTGPAPINPESNPEFWNWEIPVLKWATNNIYNLGSQSVSPYQINIQINNPKNGDFVSENNINLQAQINANNLISSIEIYLNNQLIKQYTNVLSLNYNLNYSFSQILNDKNLLQIIVKDQSGNQSSAALVIYKR